MRLKDTLKDNVFNVANYVLKPKVLSTVFWNTQAYILVTSLNSTGVACGDYSTNPIIFWDVVAIFKSEELP